MIKIAMIILGILTLCLFTTTLLKGNADADKMAEKLNNER